MEPCTINKRDEILRAALELIAEHGFHGAPAAMIAKKAQVGAGTIYRYFENKDALIQAIYDHLEEKKTRFLKKDFPYELPLEDRFLHTCRRIVEYLLHYPGDFRFLEQFYNSPYGIALQRERIFAKSSENRYYFADLLEEGIASKRIKDLPLPLLYSLIFGPMVAAARSHLQGLIVLDDALIDVMVKACWGAVRA